MELLDRLLRLHAGPDSSDMEAAIDDVLKRNGARIVECLAPEQPATSRPRIGLRFVVAVALMLTVAICVYAFRAQRESTAKVVVPAAQDSAPSVNGAAETSQVAVLTPERRKPEAAPSREEILKGVAAQIAAAQASDAGAARPKFAAASVRPVSISPEIINGFKCLGVDGLLWEPDPRVPPMPARRGRCTGQVVDLREVVQAAYATNRHLPPWERMAGFPAPPFNVFFQIEAVAEDPEHVTKGELKLMLQTLLEDRFKARVHLETREIDGYALTIAKSGIKFKETSDDAKAAVTTPTPQPTNRGGGPPPPCLSNANPANPGTPARPALKIGVRGKCGMKVVTTFLTKLLMLNSVAPPIIDKTGLMGIYDMDFVLEEVLFPTPTGGGGRQGSQEARQFDTPVPKALEQQLGLHMERVKVPGEFVVVDHLEQPTPN